MAEEKISTSGTPNEGGSKADAQPNANRIVMGIVKNNIDESKSGKITVELLGSSAGSTAQVEYLSPFLGTTNPGTSDKATDGKFLGNPQSFGFWSGAPDIGTQVLCLFDEKGRGYYIGSVPTPGMNQMIPAIGSSNKVVPNDGEASTYGGADRLPTTELNSGNPANKKSANPSGEAKPVHSYQAGILAHQGLIRDNIRGVIGSSAQRESPSRVYGMSTPGGEIYEGGYSPATLAGAVANGGDRNKQKVIGRTGGHTFVMDDGALDNGSDQLIRLRSAGGHQILMSDTGQALFVIHSNGLSWIELGKEGTVDIFATNSFNVRTKGDLNLHADNDVNINAGKKLNIYGESISVESEKDSTWRAGGAWSGYTMGNYTFKVDGSMGITSGGESAINSGGTFSLNGSKININSGSKGPQPAVVPKITKTNHIETTFSKAKGWMFPAPETLKSVTSRAPTHQPWIGSGSGVNVKINDVAPSADAPTSTPAVDKANKEAAKTTPSAVTSPAEVAAAPAAKEAAGPLPTEGVKAVTAQVATQAQSLTKEAQAAAGVVNPASGLTTNMMEAAGAIPPGAGDQAKALIAKGMPAAKALEGKLTGFAGATDVSSLTTDVTKQGAMIQTGLVASAQKLKAAGALTGNESPAQAGGPILAGLTHGAKNVASMLTDKTLDTGIAVAAGKLGGLGIKVDSAQLGSLKESLVSGKLAANLGESLGGGLGGLKESLSGVGDKLKGGMDNMKSASQNAFAAVEESFPALKGGKVNVLGQEGATPAEKSETEKAGASYDSAKAEFESAETEWFNAKRDYSYSKSDEDYDRITVAEKAMSEAKQKMSKASSAFLKSMPGGSSIASMADSASSGLSGIADKASGIGDSIKSALSSKDTGKSMFSSLTGMDPDKPSSSATSGLNALPGGAGALMAKVNNDSTSGSNPFDKIKSMASEGVSKAGDAISTKADGLKDALKDPSKLAGGALKGVSSKVEGALGAKLGALTGDSKLGASSAKGIMAQLQSSLAAAGGPGAESKAPVAATGTFDVSALKAKMGSLFGDAKIPVPTFSDSITPSPEAEKITAERTEALDKVQEAQYKVNSAKLNLRLTKSSPMPAEQKEAAVQKAQSGYEEAVANLEEAQKAYSDIVNKQA